MITTESTNPWVLILAGGEGTRLQELTREITGAPTPKQFCKLLGERSLLEATLERVGDFAPLQRTLVIVSSGHDRFSRGQLDRLPPANVIVQPCNRDTGPGVLFALLHLLRRDPEAIVAMLPSDQFIDDDRAFVAHLRHAHTMVQQFPEQIALLGIRPDRTEPGYGYIQPAERVVSTLGGYPVHRVAAFHEKPTPALAERLRNAGGLWNSFVMVFRVARMLDLARRVAETEYAQIASLPSDPTSLARSYRALPSWSFSQRVLTQIAPHLRVIQVDDFHWSDWGTRESIERALSALKQAPPWRVNPQYRRTSVAAATR